MRFLWGFIKKDGFLVDLSDHLRQRLVKLKCVERLLLLLAAEYNA